MVQSEGGSGFIVRHLPEVWGKISSGFESYNNIEDWQDRMCQIMKTCTILRQNQRDLASNVDPLASQLDAVAKRVLAIAFN